MIVTLVGFAGYRWVERIAPSRFVLEAFALAFGSFAFVVVVQLPEAVFEVDVE